VADLTKTIEKHAVTFVANTPRADEWMQQRGGGLTQRFGKHAIAFRSDKADERERAIAFEADALALTPALDIETVSENLLTTVG
jgi:hypothetical protein